MHLKKGASTRGAITSSEPDWDSDLESSSKSAICNRSGNWVKQKNGGKNTGKMTCIHINTFTIEKAEKIDESAPYSSKNEQVTQSIIITFFVSFSRSCSRLASLSATSTSCDSRPSCTTQRIKLKVSIRYNEKNYAERKTRYLEIGKKIEREEISKKDKVSS